MTDPIADLLTRIRNAYLAKHKTMKLPHSNFKLELAKVLHKAGYLQKVETADKSPRKIIKLTLRYVDNQPAITGIKRLSKPGRRLYVRATNLNQIISPQGMSIISTSQGLLTGRQARQKSLGGELVCSLW